MSTDDGCAEPNVTVLGIWHESEGELGERLAWLADRLLSGQGLPADKPAWLKVIYGNHGGGPCRANQVEVPVDISPPRCLPRAKPR